jgi:acyl carrier protein
MYALEEVKATLASLIAEAMYMDLDEIGGDELFSSYGLESATLAKIVAKVNAKYDREIDVRNVLPHQTLNEASTFIHGRLCAPVVTGGALQ